MTDKTMLFGPLGRMQAIPYPEAGMGWDFNRGIEETELLDGGMHVYEAPNTYKRYKLQYKGGTPDLQNLMDIYNGVYGEGPYYLLDFNYTEGNLLPTRWASAYQLKHVVGAWASPLLTTAPEALAGKAVTFTNVGQFSELGESIILPTVPGQPAYLRLWGSRTGAAAVKVSLLAAASGQWTEPVACVPGENPGQVVLISAAEGAVNAYSAIRLQLVCPTGASLTLDHINLTTATEPARKPGLGVGAVSFTSSLSGNIATKRFDRIGLSLDLVEVE